MSERKDKSVSSSGPGVGDARPGEFLCVDESEGLKKHLVFYTENVEDFYCGRLDGESREYMLSLELHLFMCFACQKLVEEIQGQA